MKTLLPTLLLLVPFVASAQQGTVKYDETVKIEIELPPGMESMRDQIPSSSTAARMLYFDMSATMMKDAPKEEGEENHGDVHLGGDGMQFRMNFNRPESFTYTDLDEGTVVQKTDFLGRTFLITGEMEDYPWRLGDEQSEYLGYAVLNATTQRDSTEIEVWFTPEIPISVGPDGLNGLPGLILVANYDDGRRTFTATEVNLDVEVADQLKAPKGGREVTRDEFEAIVEEKMEEMGAQRRRGGGGTVMIRRGN